MFSISLRLVFLLLLSTFCYAYLPGVAPNAFQKNEEIQLKVNSLTSTHTQIPYPYYSLPFCEPSNIVDSVENLGEILTGDKIENSPFKISVLNDVKCQLLCVKELDAKQIKLMSQRVEQEYRVNWLLDNLPAATKKSTVDAQSNQVTVYESGFPVGKKNKNGEKPFINNHVYMRILYNPHEEADTNLIRIVGFEVEPSSLRFPLQDVKNPKNPTTCSRLLSDGTTLSPMYLTDDTTQIVFTYSVEWKASNVPWSNRWDYYLLMTDDQIHWFSIINSLMIVLFLTGMVAMIMMRTLHADLKRYREMENQEEIQEETGWKLVHGDVFRPPANSLLLSVLVGSGIQMFGMTVVTMIFAVLGFLSPANRGGLMMALVILFVIMGILAGYFSARVYKLLKGQNWKKNTFLTATLFPGTIFAIFLFLNFVLKYEKSTGSVPFTTLIALISLWFGISVPLVFFGSYFGFKKPAEEIKIRTNQIPRQIPDQVWYMKPVFSILMGGILPFGAVFIELFFILSSIWLHQLYYIFGFLAIVLIILILTCAEITIVMCYFQLCSEDYHWWWRAYLTSGASAFYMFLYSIFYFLTKLSITKFASILLFFGYTTIMALGFFVMTGSIGFYACFIFVKQIYSSIKLE